MKNQSALVPLVIATLVASAVLSVMYGSHEHWFPVVLALGVVGWFACSGGR